ncbi:MAG: hypothetical protein WDO18_11720 [Acidobacteriota bacterium]
MRLEGIGQRLDDGREKRASFVLRERLAEQVVRYALAIQAQL